MSRVLTNYTSLAYAIEASVGTLPGSPTWKLLEFNTVNTLGATIKKVAREPVSKDRQRRKGTTVDLDSAVEFEHDLTKEVFKDFIEGFVFANFQYADSQPPIQSGSSFNNLAAVAATPGYSHDALSAALTAGRLVYARGFTNSVNNGLMEVDSGSTTTSTKIVGGAQADETPGNTDNATLEVAGVRGASGDLTLTVSGTTGTLASSVLDFTTLGLHAGQVIHIGGLVSAHQFDNGYGYARITSIATNAIGLDKLDSDLATDTGSGKTIDILYGAFLRNVSVDDANFLERSYHFELTLPNLASGPADAYEYAIGNYSNQVSFELPLTDKAKCSFGFIGTDTEVPTTTRKSGAATPVEPVQTSALNTTADIARLRVQQTDETGLTTCFKDLKLTLDNQISPEKCLGTLGATYMNTGNFLVNVDAKVLLTSEAVISAIKNNETVTLDFILANDDGAIAVDIPSLTLGDGSKELPVNESVIINLAGEAFGDATLGYSLGISTIPVVP